MHPIFPKFENTPNTQDSYSSIQSWALGLRNTSMDAEFSVHNFSFGWYVKSMRWGTWFNSFLKLEQMLQVHQKVCCLTHSYPLGLSNTSFNATFRLEKFRLFSMYCYPWFKGLGLLSPIVSLLQISQKSLTLLLDSPYIWTTFC